MLDRLTPAAADWLREEPAFDDLSHRARAIWSIALQTAARLPLPLRDGRSVEFSAGARIILAAFQISQLLATTIPRRRCADAPAPGKGEASGGTNPSRTASSSAPSNDRVGTLDLPEIAVAAPAARCLQRGDGRPQPASCCNFCRCR